MVAHPRYVIYGKLPTQTGVTKMLSLTTEQACTTHTKRKLYLLEKKHLACLETCTNDKITDKPTLANVSELIHESCLVIIGYTVHLPAIDDYAKDGGPEVVWH